MKVTTTNLSVVNLMTLMTLKAMGYGVVTLAGQIVDRGLEGNVEMGILVEGKPQVKMVELQQHYLGDGWVFKVDVLDKSKLVNREDFTIMLKDDRQITFYAMDAAVEKGDRLITSNKHYITVAEAIIG